MSELAILKEPIKTYDEYGKWIPCSERLPSESGRYLVVYPMLINKPWVSILWYGKPTFPEKDEPCFYALDDEYGDVEYSDVIAWMPLPEPYCGAMMKGADDETN